MEIEKLLFMAADLDGKQQEELFLMLECTLTKEELKAVKIGIGYYRMIKNLELKKAMKADLAKELYFYFNRKEV